MTGPRRGRLPAAERDRRRAEVLAAARQVLTENGYEALTMNAIAARAGASKETLYSWFGSRESVVKAVIAEHADTSAERVVAALDHAVEDLPTARHTLTNYAEALQLLLTGPTSIALNRAAMSSPALAAALLQAGRYRAGSVLEQYLARLHDAGLISAPDSSEAFGTLYGLIVRDTQIRVLLGETVPSEEKIRARAQRAVDQFLAISAR